MALAQVSETIKIFFSLAPTSQDRKLFEKLCKHLSGLRRQGLIDMWFDSAITAGNDTSDSIKTYMHTADIIVLLISSDFLASDQCVNVEMQYAQEQNRNRDTRVIPVLLRPTEWRGLPFERYSSLPSNGKAITIWTNLDKALTEVARGIHKVVEEIATRLTGTPPTPKTPQFPLSTLPYRRNPFFTDRDDILAELHQAFTSEQSSQTGIQALQGLAGMGKTLLAIEYAYRYHADYQITLWINAASSELLSSDILALADQLGIPLQDDDDEQQHFEAIRRWLQQHDRWLVVLDNLEDFSVLDQLIPLDSGGHVLLITHSQATGPFASAVSVVPMTVEDGALLLLRRAKIISKQSSRRAVSAEDFLLAMQIAQEVEGYPLALDQAGAYIEETRRTLPSYLKLYRQQQATLLGKRGRIVNEHPDPVTTTLSLTFRKIALLNPNALELLHFFAFLHPDMLPDEMLQHGASSLTGPLRTLILDDLALDEALAILQRFSLIHHQADATTLNMHHIVQIVLKKDLPKRQQQQLANQAVRLINSIFPDVLFTTWQECERYLPQAQHCARLIHEFQLTLSEGPLLLERLGSYYYQRGCYAEAETYLTQALHLQERRRGDTSDLAQTLNSLGRLYQRLGQYHEAEASHQRALELRERVLGPDDPKTAESLHNLAVLYETRGEYHEAEQFYLRVLAVDERTPEADPLETAKTLSNLALMYYLQGHYPQAEATYQRVLPIYAQAEANEDPDLAYTLNGLGTLAEKQGDYQQAEDFYQRALTIRKEALGDEHSETAHSINKLAHIAELKGDYHQAEELYRQALESGEKILGWDHPDAALFLNNLGVLAARQSQYQQARELYQRALSISTQALGPDHPHTIKIQKNLEDLSNEA